MAKKGNKDRGIFERPKGSGNWYVRCHEYGKEKWVKAKNKTEARAIYLRMKAAAAEGRVSPVRRMVSFKQLAEERKQYADVHHKRKGDDNPRVQRWIDAFGNIDASSVTMSAIERVMYQMKDEGYETATINRYVVILKAIYNRAVRDDVLVVNPAAKVQLLKTNNELVRFLTSKQEKELFEKLPEHYHAVVRIEVILFLVEI